VCSFLFPLVPRRTLATHHANGDNRPRVNTEVLQRRIRALALSWPKTYEDEPWGHPVFKVDDNRMFAGMSSHEGAVLLTVKVTPEEREVALQLPFVSVARYVGRYGWITAEIRDEESLDAALEWLRESYWLRAPAELRSAVEADE
jgi:predicted DNA-binding protein (MmcQ/YjbR family)